MSSFVHLHMHSDFSLLDGMNKIEEICSTVKQMGMNSVALTDHGNMMGSIQFYDEAKKHGVKPIFGIEGYIVEDRFDRKDRSNFHLILLAKNKVGYKNLLKICSESYISGFVQKPRFDLKLLAEHKEGLIVSTSCLKGIVTNHLFKGQTDKGRDILRFLAREFRDDLYVEVMNHGIAEQLQVLPMLENIAADHKIKVIATNDSHYLKKEHHEAHDVLLCIQTKTTIHDEHRMKYKNAEFYIKSPEEMGAIFPKEYLDNTLEIEEKCNVELDLNKIYFPVFDVPANAKFDEWLEKRKEDGNETRSDKYMRFISVEALKQKFLSGELQASQKDEYVERLKKELRILTKKKLADYFLVVADYIQWARDRGILVGPGRGSAAGSLVSYLMGITTVDPIKYGLLFERFINEHRQDFPDIDVDFMDSRRSEVVDYIVDKYGKDYTCLIGTVSRLNAKVCIRDVARALGYPVSEINRIAEKIPNLALQKKPMLKEYRETLPQVAEIAKEYPEVFRLAEELEMCKRHVGIHAAGIIISSKNISEVIPLHTVKDKDAGKDQRVIVSQYDKKDLEKAGLIKMDILGLAQLTIIDEALKLIAKRHGISVDLPL